MKTHRLVKKNGNDSLPENIWEAVNGYNLEERDRSFYKIKNELGRWELFKFSNQCSSLIFNSSDRNTQVFELSIALNTQHIWMFHDCEASIYDPRKNTEKSVGHSLLLKQSLNANITLTVDCADDGGFIIIKMPQEIVIPSEHLGKQESDPIEFFYMDQGENTQEIAKDLFQKQCHPALRQHIVYGKVYEIFNAIIQNKTHQHGTYSGTKKINEFTIAKKAEEILRTHYAEPPSLEKLAKQIGTNRNKLSQSFKAIYGKTIFEYCTQYRMSIAKQMLSGNMFSIAHVAETVGYDYPGNFTSAYKRHFGELPKATRRLQSV